MESDVRTIGVAVPIPEPYGTELQDWRRSFGDPLADAIPSHITLVPPTEIENGSNGHYARVREHLAKVASTFPPFRVRLRGTATFMPVSPVVFVALAEGISACERLSMAVRTGPLAVELSFPYHPHVTVAHYLPDEAMATAFNTLAGYEAVFDVTAFSLYEHGTDGYWRRECDFELSPEGEVAAGRPGGERRLQAARRISASDAVPEGWRA
ncbi:2'-5' RNA ligase family protein [Actinobacteria bacterium YIM 96077]|uniref:2'-5' RNA ligase family protein n=1 Tax=Phytoactinopolyspora halophila TaxID=1981511 RepID=A0A329QJA9_9ACTN|nr:2'-5' RNA ligase family protein [Phytoactinopolyspora halophila]AYY14459.1 2'-5' RNA ligase family protein [Actinobacteria bacterium YIM 96077]RAW11452.1 2'-5' RNA ligase family protein [Phytoactinopolyspora halophila]